MAQKPLLANIAELSTLNVFTFISIRFTALSVPFKVIVPKTNQLTCHSFTGDQYLHLGETYQRLHRMFLRRMSEAKVEFSVEKMSMLYLC